MAMETARTPEQLQEALSNPEQLSKMVEAGKLDSFLEDYGAQVATDTVKGAVKEAMTEGMQQFLIDHRTNSEVLPGGEADDGVEWESANVRGTKMEAGWSRETLSDIQMRDLSGKKRKNHGFQNIGDYVKSIWHMNREMDPRLKDLSVNIGGDGGFLVPEAMRSELLSVPLETSIVRPRARVIPLESLRVAFPTIDSTSHASTVFGGLAATWTDENASITEDQPVFGRILLEARKLALYTEVPNELIQDSMISVEALLAQLYPEALGYFEDDAFMNGSGAGRPLGAHNANNPALVSVTRDVSSQVNWEDIVNMYARMLPTSLGSAVWTINQEVFPQLATMALSVGTGGSAIFVGNGAAAAPATILGRPVIVTEKNAALGSAGDICFTDFGQYLLGDRQMTTMVTSAHFKFQNDQTAIRATERIDGQPWMRSALTPRNGSNTLSPFVRLAA
jgi:HK97 family phage major capsid protein